MSLDEVEEWPGWAGGSGSSISFSGIAVLQRMSEKNTAGELRLGSVPYVHAAVRDSSRAIGLLRVAGIIVTVGKAPAAVAGGRARSAKAVTGCRSKGVA